MYKDLKVFQKLFAKVIKFKIKISLKAMFKDEIISKWNKNVKMRTKTLSLYEFTQFDSMSRLPQLENSFTDQNWLCSFFLCYFWLTIEKKFFPFDPQNFRNTRF